MFKTLLADRQFIENKYHKVDEPFNPYQRMAYHGWDADNSTGLSIDEIKVGIKETVEKYAGCSREVVKARAIEYVLQNTRIAISEHDYFPLIYTWNREAASETFYKWRDEMYQTVIPEETKTMRLFSESGVAPGWPDFDHVVPDWDSMLKLGFVGLLQRAMAYKKSLSEKAELTKEQMAYFDGIEIEYGAIIRFVERLYAYAKGLEHEKAQRTADALKTLAEGAPKNFFDALMMMYLYFMVSESIDFYQVRSLGNGLDYTLSPFYFQDIEAGTFSRDEIKEFLGYFLMQWSAIGNYWGQPFYLGGSNLDKTTRVNDLSYDIIDVYSTLSLYNPKIQIKYNDNIPKDFLSKILSDVRDAKGSYVFCCEQNIIQAIMNYGATYEEAYDFDLRGCYETGVRANEVSTAGFYVNALKCVEYVFSNGYDVRINEQVGLKTGNVENFTSFEDFYKAFLTQWGYIIDTSLKIVNQFEKYLSFVNPSSLYSATIEYSVKQGKDGYQNGVKFNNSAQLNCGFASAVDALMAVNELVYEKQVCSLSELKQALLVNWTGYEKLRLKARNCKHKYGNNDELADNYAREMAAFFARKTSGKNARGGVHKSVMHSAMQFVWCGKKTLASADGRCAGDEMSKNASPSIGADREGATALILSALKLQPTIYTESFCVDVMLNRNSVQGGDGLSGMKALLDVYARGGGQSLQFNVFTVETLRDAQANPDKYKNLQVRVSGWNVLWNNLSHEEQEAYIRRVATQG